MEIFKAKGRPSNILQKIKTIVNFIVDNHPAYTVFVGFSKFTYGSPQELISSMDVKGCFLNSNGVIQQTQDSDYVALSEALKLAFSLEKKNPGINAKRLITDYAQRIVKLGKADGKGGKYE